MTRSAPATALVWALFAVAHLLVAVLGWVLPSQPMGDVVLVYLPWSSAALDGSAIVGITEPWVYPQLALVPMMLAHLPATVLEAAVGVHGAYLIGWAVLVTICDLLAFAVLVGRGRSHARVMAGGFWAAAIVLLGPVGLYRIDAVVVPLAVMGGLWLARRPVVGTVLLTVGAWIKVWPGALALAAVVALRARRRVALAAAVTTVLLVLALLLAGAGGYIFGFLGEQTGRGLQIEAVAATPFLWMAATGAASISYSYDILTFQVAAPGVEVTAALLTPLMVLVVAAVVGVGVWSIRAGATWQRLLPPLSLALVTALIVTNKVGSPQFQTWLLAPVVLWIVYDRARALTPMLLALVLCALTFAIYPVLYDALLHAQPLPILVLTVRNVLLLILFVYSIRAVLRAALDHR